MIFTSDNGPHSEGGANPVYFNSSGDEVSGGSDYLKIVLQPTGLNAPAIAGRHPLTAILAKNRDTDDHFVTF